ncbi:hypothetical protein [Clostridium aminobutyricum]|uniref:Uncharacterized protein n=1 Tax=Clostridium aminobutyricum TaxID=33953 RepID=A0A939IH52_CLOAM|nr:hypothetical protein [Clostridium aminobutyricum]MBN7773157.1 hypothetical protein [Clostridium aminobutyricum]
MNLALINKETNICENIAVFDNVEIATNMFIDHYIIAEVEADYGIGDTYKDGEWIKAVGIRELVDTEYEPSSSGASNKRGRSISQKLASFLMRH